jgi:dipeptidyl aminopeptidase/acylaminoacyl peptidase
MTQPLSPERLVYDLVAAADPRISPDGTRIVYARGEVDRDTKKSGSQLWLCDIEGQNARRLTWDGQQNGAARWSPDGSSIAFTSDRLGSQENGLFLLPLDGGEARTILRSWRPIGDLAWSPDGQSIAFTSPFDPANPDGTPPVAGAVPPVRATRRLDYKEDNRGDGYLGDTRTQVFVVDVANGDCRMLTHDLVDHNGPSWSPDGQTIAVQVPNHNSIYAQLGLVSVATGSVDLIGPPSGAVGVWSWSPNGDRIIFAGDVEQTWQLDFFVYDVASGQVRRLTDDLQCLPDAGYPSLAPPSQPVWLDDRRVLFHAVRAGASGLYAVDAESGQVETIHESQDLNAGLSVDTARRFAVQGHGSLTAVGEISVYDLKAGTARVITTFNERVFTESPPATWERFEVRRDPFTIEAWLLKPPGFDPTKRYPVVLDVHGGPNGYHGYGINGVQQALATDGFLVVFCNPRGSSSYGRHFTRQVTSDWGGEDFQDLMAVVDAVLEHPYADPDRLGIFGYSYGGFMTAWTIGQTDRFAAAVCGAPVFEFTSFYGTSDIGQVFGALQWGDIPHEGEPWHADRSPSTFAHRISTPTLILHGEADQRCPIGQGEQMFIALSDAGCETEFVRYPGASHLFLVGDPPEYREDFLIRTHAWFRSHLGEPR